MNMPPAVGDFKTYFVRDFNFAPSGDANNLDFITDTDITRAINEGLINFNQELFGDNATTIFMYLAAYTLVVNLQNSAKGISMRFYGLHLQQQYRQSYIPNHGIQELSICGRPPF